MLLILTVLGMGVPAMFAAERKSYVNQAMQQLIEIHMKCQKLQRELAARGDGGVVQLEINSATTLPKVKVTVTGTTNFTAADVDTWFGRKINGSSGYVSINADEFISSIGSTVGAGPSMPLTTAVTTPIIWDYEKQSGFLNRTGSPGTLAYITLTFNAMPTGASYKVKRDLHLFPQGYTEVP